MTTTRAGAPANLDAERFVLGAFLKDSETIKLYGEDLTPEDFFSPQHQAIFAGMKAIVEEGHILSLVTLREALVKTKTFQAVGGAAALTELQDEVGTTAGLGHYVEIIQQKSKIRKMIKAATDIANKGYDVELDVNQYLDEAETQVFQVLKGGFGEQMKSARDIMAGSLALLQKQQELGGALTGTSTGLTDLDEITLGFQDTDLIILAARPAMGKTSLALSFAADAALQQNKWVSIFSLEMSAEQLGLRLVSMDAHVNLHRMMTSSKAQQESDFRKITKSLDRWSQAPMYIDDTPAITLPEIRARTRRLALRGECDLVLIDYLQLLGTTNPRLPREQQISSASRGLKALAKELNVPVIALSQLNRSVESRPNKRPMLSDLRESGAIEQDADLIMFIYRDDYYHPDSEAKDIAEIIVGKHRHGATGTAEVHFKKEFTVFRNLARNSNPFVNS